MAEKHLNFSMPVFDIPISSQVLSDGARDGQVDVLEQILDCGLPVGDATGLPVVVPDGARSGYF